MAMAQRSMALVGANGMKSFVSLGDLDDWMEKQIRSRTSGNGDIDKYFGDVSWLYRGTMLRAQAVAGMPFDILRGETVIDSSDDYQNELEFLPDPETLLLLIEMSLTLTGTAYLAPDANRFAQARKTFSELYYYAPQTIKPIWDKPTGKLIRYDRKLGTHTIPLQPDSVFSFWYPDYSVEAGPPEHYPARAAAAASGVLLNLDAFVEAFFGRGAIKTTLIALAGNPPQQERDRFGALWSNAMQGIRNAWEKLVISADNVTAIPVGEGVKDLQNTELTGNSRDSIAAALTIPTTKLFSGSAAGLGGKGVSEGDDLRFLIEFAIPECDWIARQFNKLIFNPLGYRLRFKPETLDAMQEDEVARMTSMSSLIDVLLKATSWEMFLASAKVNGMEWDNETNKLLQQVFAQKQERRAEIQAQTQQPQPEQANMQVTKPEPPMLEDTQTKAMRIAKETERKQFKTWAAKREQADWHNFKFAYLNEAEQAAIGAVKKNSGMKSIGATSQRFQNELTQLVNDAWVNGGKIAKDMRALITQYVEDAFDEGLLESGSTPDVLDSRDLVDELIAEQLQYVDKFSTDVKDATGDLAQQDSIRKRIALWAESIYRIGQRGWAQGQATRKQRIQWHTVGQDELVCPICAPLNDKIIVAGKEFAPGIYSEPAHSHCRCSTTVYVD